MSDTYGLDGNSLPQVFNPPPGWNEVLVSWQAKNVGWAPPTPDWVPTAAPGARPAPAGWRFWVPNPVLLAKVKAGLLRRALLTSAIGIALIVAGIAATAIGQNMASPGGTFFVFTGLIVVGLYRFVLGIVRLIRVPFAATKALTKTRQL